MKNSEYITKIFEVIPSAHIVLKPNPPFYTVLGVNDAYLSFIPELNKDQILNKSIFEVFQDNIYFDQQEFNKTLKLVFKTKKPQKNIVKPYPIYVNNLSEVSIKYLEITNSPVLDKDGEIEFIVRSVVDVTDTINTKRTEKAIISDFVNHKKFFNETQKVTKTGTWELNIATEKIIWSKVVKEIFEVDDYFQPTLEATIDYCKSDYYKNHFQNAIQELKENGAFFNLELEITTEKSNNSWIFVSGHAEIFKNKTQKIYGVIQDITQRKLTELSLSDSKNKFKSIIQHIEAVVWEADAETFEPYFISDYVFKILGYTAEDFYKSPNLWFEIIHSDDKLRVLNRKFDINKKGHNFSLEYRMMHANGNTIWVRDSITVEFKNEKPKLLRGLVVDNTQVKIAAELDNLEKNILELCTQKETSLKQILDVYIKGIESLFPDMLCSIQKIKNGRIENLASISLPKEYLQFINQVQIGENVGSCGTAAYLKKRVIVENIQEDPLWVNFKSVAIKHELKACWSHPIFDSNGEVVATFALYYKEIKAPNEDELKVINKSISLLELLFENKKNTELIDEKTALLEKSQELAGFGSWVWDLENNEFNWSDHLYRIFGQDKNTFKANYDNYLKILHPEDRVKTSIKFSDTLKNKENIEYDERIVRPDGEIRHLRSWLKIQLNEDGYISKIIGTSLDVTENKISQEKLLESESRLRSLVNSQTNYITRIDISGNFTYCNYNFIHDYLWFFESEILIGLNFLLPIYPYHHNRFKEIIKNCFHSPNEVFKAELDLYDKEGKTKYTHWHFICLTDTTGNPSEIQCTGMDFTYRKKIEEELKSSNKRYEYVNKATNNAIYDWNILNDDIVWGDGFYKITGYNKTKKEYPIAKWAKLTHPDDIHITNNNLSATLRNKSKQNWSAEYRLKKANGSYIYIDEMGYIIRDKYGRAIRMIGVLNDITERKLAEKKLKELNAELEKNHKTLSIANIELEQFAYIASHDLQEPLRMISGFLNQIDAKYGNLLDERGKQYIYYAVDGAVRMREIILDLLDFSRIGKTEENLEEINIKFLVQNILKLYKNKIEVIKAEMEIINLPTSFLSYKELLRQIFQNLIGNALKYHIKDSIPKITISAKECESCYQFLVEDNGIGIEEEHFERIFIVFQRLHHRDEYSGTGIGLSITKKIIENLGGKIWLESVPNIGTKFHFTLPKNINTRSI